MLIDLTPTKTNINQQSRVKKLDRCKIYIYGFDWDSRFIFVL